MIIKITHDQINPLDLPEECIVMQDQPTIRQICSLVGATALITKPLEEGTRISTLRFQYGRHECLVIRETLPPGRDYLHAVLIPAGTPNASGVLDGFLRAVVGACVPSHSADFDGSTDWKH